MSIFHHDHHHQHEHRRGFLKKSFLFLGSLAAPTSFARAARPHSQEDEPGHHHHPNPAAAPAPVPAEAKKAEEPYRIFDAHLHCPSEDGAVWQWYPVTKSFEEFVSYLDRSGVERGIINSVRCQSSIPCGVNWPKVLRSSSKATAKLPATLSVTAGALWAPAL